MTRNEFRKFLMYLRGCGRQVSWFSRSMWRNIKVMEEQVSETLQSPMGHPIQQWDWDSYYWQTWTVLSRRAETEHLSKKSHLINISVDIVTSPEGTNQIGKTIWVPQYFPTSATWLVRKGDLPALRASQSQVTPPPYHSQRPVLQQKMSDNLWINFKLEHF